MSEENLISVNVEEAPVIQLEITAQDNKVDLSFAQSIASSLGAHNSSQDAHSTLLNTIVHKFDEDISSINSTLAVKSNISDTYSKTEVDDLFDSKLASSTMKGNLFNGADQLVELNSLGQLPAIDGSLLSNVTGTGISKFENKGAVTTELTLTQNVITVATFSGSVSITLPTVTDTTKQVTCVLDFITTSSAYPRIVNTNLKWSDKNLGKAPSSYSVLAGVRNLLVFKTIWIGETLYWEASYNSYGGVECSFTRPNLSSNGTLGGTTFAVYSSNVSTGAPAYNAFDGSSSTWATWASGASQGDLVIYNPNPLNITNLAFTNTSTFASYGYPIGSCSVYGSNDNSIYTFLQTFTNSNAVGSAIWNSPLSYSGFFKYTKLVLTPYSGYSSIGIVEIAMAASYIST